MTELMMLLPDAEALERPLETADAAEAAEAVLVVDCAEATAPRATTVRSWKRMMVDLMGLTCVYVWKSFTGRWIGRFV